MKRKERPGVIFYFDSLRTLEKMSPEGQAAFLMACLRYGRDHEHPDFNVSDVGDQIRLDTLWEVVQPRIDSDAESWAEGVKQRRYAGYCSAQARRGAEAMEYAQFGKLFDDGLMGW